MRHWHLAVFLPFAALLFSCDDFSPLVYRDDLIGTFESSKQDVSETLVFSKDGTFEYRANVGGQVTEHSGRWHFEMEKRRMGDLGFLVFHNFVSSNPRYTHINHVIFGTTPGYSKDRTKIEICYDNDRVTCFKKSARAKEKGMKW
jgi:hypothetical protein